MVHLKHNTTAGGSLAAARGAGLVQLVRDKVGALLAAEVRRRGELLGQALLGAGGVEQLRAPRFALVHLRGGGAGEAG